MKVLLIDDESPVRERLMEAMSEVPGVQVDVAASLSEGDAEAIQASRPDVAVVDVHISQGRGLDLIRKIRTQFGANPPIIVAIANVSSVQYRVRCHEAGATYFFNRVREQEMLLESLSTLSEELGR
jgi:two-component system, NarL family, response regulator DevR